MEGRKGGRSGSNRMILIHSNVIKLFKNNTLTLYCFANRSSLDESSNSMDENFFLKKIEATRFIRISFPLTTIVAQSEEWSI